MPRRLTYTPKIGAEICTMIAEGVGLKAACEKLGLNRACVRGWIDNRADFGEAYDKARRHRADHFQDEILEISDSVTGCEDPAAVNAARLQVDSRKWLASKLLPERFGDRTELVGAGGAPLIPTDPMSDEKMAVALLNIFHAAPGGRNHPDALEAPAPLPAMASATTTLLSGPAAPAEPEPEPTDHERALTAIYDGVELDGRPVQSVFDSHTGKVVRLAPREGG